MEEMEIKIDCKFVKALCYHIIDVMNFYEMMEATPNCNTCSNLKECGHAPDFGEKVRWNCHLYEPKGIAND